MDKLQIYYKLLEIQNIKKIGNVYSTYRKETLVRGGNGVYYIK